ncbi:MAG TPA: IspD/TarI family cytidylyltransferase [Ktedonobacterales bacterium]
MQRDRLTDAHSQGRPRPVGPPSVGPCTVAVVLCAGQGSRMGAPQNKVFLPVGGLPLLVRTLQAFEAARGIDEILLVAHPDETEYVASEILGRYPPTKIVHVVAGGATRHQSERHALAALRARIEAGEIGIVLMHDGARPLVTPDDVERVVTAARASGAAILAAAFTGDDVVFAVDSDHLLELLPTVEQPSDQLLRAQTPQGFDARTLLRAYDQAQVEGFEGTDTAATLERLGISVMAVLSASPNPKITTPDDLLRAEALLAEALLAEAPLREKAADTIGV